jgi:hypothetical protein
MNEQTPDRVPPTPREAVRSYYRIEPGVNLWLYHDGEKWVGPPTALPWYKRPMPWAVGRAPVWAGTAIGVVMFAVIIVGLLTR